MMEICCYILFSPSLDKFYIGSCQESLSGRIEKHNSGYYGGKSLTSQVNDWELFLKIQTEDFSHAVRLERKIKRMKSSVYIRNLKNYPELVSKIYNEMK